MYFSIVEKLSAKKMADIPFLLESGIALSRCQRAASRTVVPYRLLLTKTPQLSRVKEFGSLVDLLLFLPLLLALEISMLFDGRISKGKWTENQRR